MIHSLTERSIRLLGECALLGYRSGVGVKNPVLQKERLGLGNWPEIYAKVQEPVWVHAASLGEVKGIAPLLASLQDMMPLVGSTTSATGLAEIQKHLPDAGILPFDARSVLDAHIAALKPKLLVINETELWPNLLFSAFAAQIPVMLVNARISDKSFPRYKRIFWLTRRMLQPMRKILAQTEEDRRRLIALGANQEKIQVTGSTKYDTASLVLSEEQRAQEVERYGLNPSAPCILAGSVREGEYEQVVQAYLRVREKLPSMQMIIAPRHPEYFQAVADYLGAASIPFILRSEQRQNSDSKQIAPVLLLDTVGELSQFYPLANVAFVGGTLVPIGGHNPLEAASAGVPILIGPHTQNVRELVTELCAEGAAVVVDDSESLSEAILQIVQNSSRRSAAATASSRVAQRHRGAVTRVSTEVAAVLSAM